MTPETNGQTANRASVEASGERDIVVERIFDAPRDRVFAVMSDPELIPEWWGPHGHRTRVETMEFEVGGRWRFVSDTPDGSEGFSGTYRRIEAPELIEQTFEWDGMPGYISVELMTLEDLGERTRLRTVSTFHRPEERDGMLGSGMEGGLQETYERLDALLAKG